jgi:hypothetical protein
MRQYKYREAIPLIDQTLVVDPTNLNAKSLRLIEALRKTAGFRSEYGQDFVFLIAGRGIRISEAADLAAKRKKEGGNIIDYVIEGEREALRRRYFFATS